MGTNLHTIPVSRRLNNPQTWTRPRCTSSAADYPGRRPTHILSSRAEWPGPASVFSELMCLCTAGAQILKDLHWGRNGPDRLRNPNHIYSPMSSSAPSANGSISIPLPRGTACRACRRRKQVSEYKRASYTEIHGICAIHQKCSGGSIYSLVRSPHTHTPRILERPICRQCTSGNRHDECKWDPAPLTKEEKLEARVRELEEQVEVSWERQRSANSPERRLNTISGQSLCILMSQSLSY